ncbi:hypothetical protein GCM10010441_07930 [Kitasatospora paracochleata]|uniref:Meckel syndrome type 1 protein n=1 Tax=Kitasatospora paracochleata TaxID=58354 RepID=A0ABT1J9U1_9ACTN|nr:hypothetical protein [Kitasatospora paracochleata]MCP2314133.1 hypothetical protein [Kitasatospora paracochleata]
MPEKPKKKVAGLSTTPAARRAAAAARAQAGRQQRGADVFGGDVDELVNRSFVGQGAQAAASDVVQHPAPLPMAAATVPVPPTVPAQTGAASDAAPTETQAVPAAGATVPAAENPWLAPRTAVAVEASQSPPQPVAEPDVVPEPVLSVVESAAAATGARVDEASAVSTVVAPSDQPVAAEGSAAPSVVTQVVSAPEPAAAPSAVAVEPPAAQLAVHSGPAAPAVVAAPEAGAAGAANVEAGDRSAPAPAPVGVQAVAGSLPQDVQQSGGDSTPSAPAAAVRQPRRSSGRRSAPGVARQAVLTSWTESTMDLKLGKNQWRTLPFRFAPDLVAALSARVGQDREASGRQLTIAQYVDAAMRLYLPAATDAQLALAEAFFIRREGDVPAGRQASHRVSPGVYEVASKLPNDLRMVGRARTGVHVYSAALDLFLTALGEEGPLV